MEKVTQSPGVSKVKKIIGNTRLASGDIDPIYNLRVRYGYYFEKKKEKIPSQKEDLNEILDQEIEEEESLDDKPIWF